MVAYNARMLTHAPYVKLELSYPLKHQHAKHVWMAANNVLPKINAKLVNPDIWLICLDVIHAVHNASNA